MTALAWNDADYKALIDRLLTDLATARGMTVPQVSMYYCLPDRPPMHPQMEATPWRTPRT